jgi:fused signal recognition particle receptor
MGKIVRVVKPDVKLFIGDALAGNDTINQAREFFQYTNFDGAILTKVDADAKGGSAISIAHITSKPVVYIGVGQDYDDIIPFDPDKFIGSLFGGAGEVSVESLISIPKAPEDAIEKSKSEETQETKEEEKEEVPLLPKPPVQPSSRSVSIFVAPKAEQNVEAHAPKPIVDQQPELPKVEEQPKEKKGRFGFFGKKGTKDDRSKQEEEDKKEQRRLEEKRAKKEEEEEAKRKHEEEEQHTTDKKQQEEEKEEDKTIYLTDEDIEDLLR